MLAKFVLSIIKKNLVALLRCLLISFSKCYQPVTSLTCIKITYIRASLAQDPLGSLNWPQLSSGRLSGSWGSILNEAHRCLLGPEWGSANEEDTIWNPLWQLMSGF